MKTRARQRKTKIAKRSAKRAAAPKPKRKSPARSKAKPRAARTQSAAARRKPKQKPAAKKQRATPKRSPAKKATTRVVRARPVLSRSAPRVLRSNKAVVLCIPVIVPVRRAELLAGAPKAVVIEAVAPEPPKPKSVTPALAAAPAPAPRSDASSAPLIGVRIGRLPPRSDAPSARSGSAPPPEVAAQLAGTASAALSPVTPSRPRIPITPETWHEIDRAAARLGIEALRTEQRRVMRSVLEGRDTLAAFPAGFGKSACFLAPALLFSQPVLVVSARPRLLRSQYDRLLQRRIPVAWLDGQGGRDRAQALASIAAGGPLVVFAAPVALGSHEVLSALARSGLALAVIDDAHAASEWSDELRPACMRMGETLARLGAPPMLALLAASTPATRHDVVSALGLRAPVVIDGPAVRDNIALDAVECRGEVRQRLLIEQVMRLRRPGIVYCTTPREVDAVHSALGALRLPVHRYHCLMAPGERLGEQLNFLLPGRRSIMIATSGFAPASALAGVGEAELLDRAPEGFGLGLDKRDLRFVIHYGAPTSLEQYAREIGAAGRDGEPANALLLYAPEDRGRSDSLLAELRLAPAHVLGLTRALEPYAIERRSATLEALALSSGLSRRTTENVAAALEDAGVIARSGGWARVIVDVPALFDRARRISAAVDTLRKQDTQRASLVADYARNAGCRSAFLARYFGAETSGRSCACAACKPGSHPVSIATPPSAEPPRRRPPVQEFSISRIDDRRGESQRPLTAKLGDFSVFAKSR